MDYSPFNFMIILFSSFCFFANAHFVFCIFFPQQRTGQLKQPLNVLLGTLLGSTITLHLCILSCAVMTVFQSSVYYFIVIQMALFTMRASITSSLWLNVFYFCQIVPATCSFLICLKRNIRCFIYSALVADKIFFLFGFSTGITCSVVRGNDDCENYFNTTYGQFNETQNATMDTLKIVSDVDVWLRCGYLLLCLCVMLTSNCVTILYLQKHMKRIEGRRFSPVKRQMRVTITGIIQTFLSFICFVWFVVDEISPQYADLYSYIYATIGYFYSLGTTINLCVGQTIFRRSVVDVYQKCLQTFAF